jgi:ParB family chromosome partitioning protein
MGASLQEMTESARATDRLQQQLAAGEAVVSLDTAQIDGSKVADRIPDDLDPSFDALVSSISEHGQQVPILVRPHPEKSSRYQIAYGRRRLRAATQLGRQVKAIVRNLSDVELVIAQGRENLDRADLSFIEKAFFAKNLEDAGFDRATLVAALSTDKADLSRYIATARRIPYQIVASIGPAPKVGRARWLALSGKIEDVKLVEVIQKTLEDPDIVALDSNMRFQAAWKVVNRQPGRPGNRPKTWVTPEGKKAGQIKRVGNSTALVFNEKVVPEFAIWVSARLDRLFAEFSGDKTTSENE